MIEYQNASAVSVRCLESDVAGRRVAAYAAPYSGEVGDPRFRFDPLDRRLILRRSSGRVAVGPVDPAAWARTFSRCPPGPVAIGPASAVEEIRGAHAAAAEGAARTGRGVYLIDAERAGLPLSPRHGFTALFVWAPEETPIEQRLSAARELAIPAGTLLPILPGWTDETEFLTGWFERMMHAGAQFTAAVAAAGGGEDRRRLVEARERVEPGSVQGFFEKVHHCDWSAAVRAGLRRFRMEAARRGLPVIPPRPRGAAEPPGNSAAAAHLEERAAELEDDDHRAALLHAAARWIDESGRDLGPVVREGNFGKVFPFGALAAEAEAAFRVERR
jgi:hypothetical protein